MAATGIERVFIVAAAALALSAPAFGQYREYFIRGRVVDTQKQPLAGVEIHLRDAATSRSYHLRTEKDGSFKFAGLPHGVYEATLSKPGYPDTKVEWKFEAPQDTMQRVEIPEIVLASQNQVQRAAQAKAAEEGTKQAAEKIRQRDFDGAIAQLRALLEKDPGSASASFFLGLAFIGKQMYPEAVEALTRTTQQSPTFPGAYFELGVSLRQLPDLPRALAAFERSLELEPQNADAAYNAGLTLFELGRTPEALARFEQGLQSRPQDPDLLEMVGRCHLNQAQLGRAVEYLEKARAVATDAARVAFLDKLIAQAKAAMK